MSVCCTIVVKNWRRRNVRDSRREARIAVMIDDTYVTVLGGRMFSHLPLIITRDITARACSAEPGESLLLVPR